jgi:hypothetical protein
MRFFQLSFLADVINCFSAMTLPFVKSPATVAAINIVFICYGMTITVWCLLRLRMIQSDVPSAPQQA